jgi:hypothetical protein
MRVVSDWRSAAESPTSALLGWSIVVPDEGDEEE